MILSEKLRTVFGKKEFAPESVQEMTKRVLGLESNEDLEILKQRVKTFKGEVRVIVHPFYDNHLESNKLVRDYTERQISNQNTTKEVAPLFIFEEEKSINKVEAISDGKVPVIRTYSDLGVPITEKAKASQFRLKSNDFLTTVTNREFENLTKIFHYLGITTLHTSGLYGNECLQTFEENMKVRGFGILRTNASVDSALEFA